MHVMTTIIQATIAFTTSIIIALSFLVFGFGWAHRLQQNIHANTYNDIVRVSNMEITKVITLFHIKIKQMIPLWDTSMQWTWLFRMRQIIFIVVTT